MALTIKKKHRPVHSGRKLGVTDARERYHELVQAAADEGVEQVDLAVLQPVCFALKKSIDDFHADVNRLEVRREAIEQLQEAHAAQPEIEKLRDRVREISGELETLRSEYYAEELPLVQQLSHDQDALRVMLDEQRSNRDDAMRRLQATADPSIMEKIAMVRKQRTRICDKLDALPRELAQAEHKAKVFDELRRQFADWKAGKRIELPVDGTMPGMVKLPAWHEDAGEYGTLAKPTPAVVAACKARLDRITGNAAMPEEIRQSIAECKQAIARYDAQVEELHAEMLK